jgi:putative membrane protein
MRWVYLTFIILFVVAIALFSIQNVQSVTLSFLGSSIRTPLAILTAVVYALGAITGGRLFAALRKSIRAT